MAKVIADDTEVKQGQEKRNVDRTDLWVVVGMASSAWRRMSWRLQTDMGHREVSLYSHLNTF